MDEIRLTAEAKEQVRSYMIKIVAVPGIVLSLIAFSAGFFVQDIFFQKVYNDAYKDASTSILSLTKEATEAAVKAKYSADQVNAIIEKMSALVAEGEELRSKLITAEAFQKSNELTSEVAAKIISKLDLEKLLAEKFEKDITNIKTQINALDRQVVKYDAALEIFNPASGLNLDVAWPGHGKPGNGSNVQVYKDLSNPAQAWKLRR